MGGAAEPQPSGKGGKKAMDAAINLVPYIDLLMTIMTFLVMTAVWTQIAALEVQNASGNAPQEPSEPDPDAPKAIFVLLSSTEVKVQEEGKEAKAFPNVDATIDRVKISEELERLRQARPDRKEVKVKSEPDVLFESVAEVIDIATGTCQDKTKRDTCLYQITLNPV
jgi:biopolymer transport protein ExbD